MGGQAFRTTRPMPSPRPGNPATRSSRTICRLTRAADWGASRRWMRNDIRASVPRVRIAFPTAAVIKPILWYRRYHRAIDRRISKPYGIALGTGEGLRRCDGVWKTDRAQPAERPSTLSGSGLLHGTVRGASSTKTPIGGGDRSFMDMEHGLVVYDGRDGKAQSGCAEVGECHTGKASAGTPPRHSDDFGPCGKACTETNPEGGDCVQITVLIYFQPSSELELFGFERGRARDVSDASTACSDERPNSTRRTTGQSAAVLRSMAGALSADRPETEVEAVHSSVIGNGRRHTVRIHIRPAQSGQDWNWKHALASHLCESAAFDALPSPSGKSHGGRPLQLSFDVDVFPCHDHDLRPDRRPCEGPSSEGPPQRSGRTGPGLLPWRLRRVIAFIDANLAKPLRLTDMADSAGLSRMHFAAQFQRSTGIRPHLFLQRRRIRLAQALMRDTELPLAQIALQVGFQSQSHFTTVFRQSVGETPRRWRVDHRKVTRHVATDSSSVRG